MGSYSRLADLPVTIEEYDLELKERETSSDFTRTSTVIVLRGKGETGYGEDVTYEGDDQHAFFENPTFPQTGEFTHRGFSETVGESGFGDSWSNRAYRRWGFESAALDLALKQAGTNLAAVLEREYEPVRFVASTRLGDPPTFDRIETLRERNPDVEFKLDPTSDWTAELIERLAETGRVRILDLKSQYEGTSVDQPVDFDLYQTIVDHFPDAIIEDPALTDETQPLFDGHEERLSWDASIHGIDDIEQLPFEPSVLNIKPSRFGSVESLLDTIDYCLEREVTLYGGGQFELDVGREHIHAIASLFYPYGPNDVAPKDYNNPDLPENLERSPLDPPNDPNGFQW